MRTSVISKKRNTCRYCGSSQLKQFLSLGHHPPSNSFINKDQINTEHRSPLEVYLCQSCYLVQLIDVVSAEAIFDDYLYLSSSSKALKKHYANLAEYLTVRFRLKKDDVVVDIGCNDGILLNGYTKKGLIRVGVEPSKIAEVAVASGLEVIKSFFNPRSARRITKKYGRATVVTATNVFAHVDDILEFVSALPLLLEDQGIFVIEAPYLVDMIDQTIFDTIYHEHLCYLSLTPMVPFLARFNLCIFDVERIPFGASGPALRIFVAKPGTRLVKSSVKKMLKDEIAWGVKDMKRYHRFALQVKKVKTSVLRLIKKVKRQGAQLGGYGAPAKGNTLLNYFGITPKVIPYIAETNPLKQGLLTPGSHIPIISEEEFIALMPEYALLLSWNYLDFFLEKSEYIRKGGKFLVPLPVPRIVP